MPRLNFFAGACLNLVNCLRNSACKYQDPMLNYSLLKICRRGGMADASDSKSDEGNLVRVQVPLPAEKAPFVYNVQKQLFT